MLHALGNLHEQSRPDRDDYINFYPENSSMAGAYTKMSRAVWMTLPPEHGGDFELESVMMYGSMAASVNKQAVTTTKSGEKFNGGRRITSMDAMQIQAKVVK